MTNRNQENLLLDIFWLRHQGNVYTYFLFPEIFISCFLLYRITKQFNYIC